MIEGENGGAEGRRLIAGIWLKLQIDVDGELSRANGREGVRLQDQILQLAKVHDERRTDIRVVPRSSQYFSR